MVVCFDPPIDIEYPNMTGLPAGGLAYFLSFNHDTNQFEIVAWGHIPRVLNYLRG